MKRGAGRILVISDGSLAPAAGREVLDAGIVEQLVALGLAVDVFAVGGWGRPEEEEGAAADNDAGGGGGGGGSVRKPSPSSLGYRPQLAELARASGGSVSPLESAVELLGSLRARMVAQRSKYRVDREARRESKGEGEALTSPPPLPPPVEIGGGLVRVPVYAYGYTAEEKVQTLKKTTVRAAMVGGAAAGDPEALDDGGDAAPAARARPDVVYERGYMRIPVAAAGGGDAGDDDGGPPDADAAEAATGEVLAADEITKAYKYGSS